MAGKEEEGGLRGEKGGQTAGGKAKVAGDGGKKKGGWMAVKETLQNESNSFRDLGKRK